MLHLPTPANTISLDFHHNDAISSEGDKKNDLISKDESDQHRYNQFLLFPIFQKAHTQSLSQTNVLLPLWKIKSFLWTGLATAPL